MTKLDLNSLSDVQLRDLAQALNVLEDRKKYNKQEFLFPETGARRRELYTKSLAFFEAGAIHKERALVAGNRTGKTFTAEAEMSWHLNGRYPEWWVGKRFNHPILAWEIGKTNLTTRDILQKYLIGNRYDPGTGMLPKEDLFWDNKFHLTTKAGIPDAVQDVHVKHYTNGNFDGYSHVSFKSYDQGVEAFMGTSIHVVHMDEEPENRSIYSECLMRTMTTNGIMMCTFTPLQGLSEVVLSFLPNGKFPEGGMGVVNV